MMTYNHPKAGIINLSSEELPTIQKVALMIFKIGAFVFGGVGAAAFVVFTFVDFPSMFFMGFVCGAVCGAVTWLCIYLAKKQMRMYNEARAEVLTMIERGELDLFNEDEFYGIIINSAEVGTNLLGWVRGVDQTSSLTPVSARFTFTNKTGKAIKYITLGICPYNEVGDPVTCTVRNISLYNCKCTGPFAPNGKYTQTLEHAWYNTDIDSVKIESAEIIYMDNSTETLSMEQIECLPSNAIFSDNESRTVRGGFGMLLMVISGIIDVISLICIFTINTGLFSVLTVISTVAFFIGLRMKR